MIYKATVKSENTTKFYIGSTANTFKARWYAHKSHFKNAKNNGTELSKYIWNLKNKNKEFDINWEMLHHIGEPYSCRDNNPLEKEEMVPQVKVMKGKVN